MAHRALFFFLSAVLLAASLGAQEFDPRGLVEAIRTSTRGRQNHVPAASSGRPYVALNRFICAGIREKGYGSPEELQRDLQEVRTTFAACGVDVRLGRDEEILLEEGRPCPRNFSLEVDHTAKSLSPSQRSLFGRYHRAAEGLSVFYLPIGSAGPVLAGTAIPADYIRDVKGDNARDRESIGAVVVFSQARANIKALWTLPHEMGHVLTNDPNHDKGGLMASPAEDRTLSAKQCERIRSSPFTRRGGR